MPMPTTPSGPSATNAEKAFTEYRLVRSVVEKRVPVGTLPS